MRKKTYIPSNFICSECGTMMPLQRPKGEQRRHGHIKDIYCYKCKKETKFKEIKQKEAFELEFGKLMYV